jgi:hypothetical protein
MSNQIVNLEKDVLGSSKSLLGLYSFPPNSDRRDRGEIILLFSQKIVRNKDICFFFS